MEPKEVLDEEIPTYAQVDHDYEAPSQTPSTSQACGPSAVKRKRHRVTLNANKRNSNKLLEMSEETLRILTQINENTTSMAQSLKIIASAMPK